MAKIKLPKGWHRGNPRKAGIYAMARESFCKSDGSMIGNGYAEWTGARWIRHKNWGNYIKCSDIIWAKGEP